MKIWYGYGSEHSANLVIVGTFEDTNTSQEAEALLNRLTDIARRDEASGFLDVNKGVKQSFSQEMLALAMSENFMYFNHGDPEELLFDYKAVRSGKDLIVTTDETMIGAFIKVMLSKSAKIQIFSAHEHETPFGRNTRS